MSSFIVPNNAKRSEDLNKSSSTIPPSVENLKMIHISSNMINKNKHPSFKEFKDDISNFEMKRYLENKMESNRIEKISLFLELYKKIEEEDLKKPIFSQTTKFKKFPNHLKYYKYIKFSRDEETRKKWIVQQPQTEVEKIVFFIKSMLNKIGENNFESVKEEFLDGFLQFDHPDLFEVLVNELYIKCISDSKFRHFYLQICCLLCQNKRLHENRYEVIDIEGDFYVHFKYPNKEYGLEKINEENMIGPFTSENDAKQEAYMMMNLKRYFMNFLEKKFKEKDTTFGKKDLEDQEFFDKKRNIIGMVDIMLILYKDKFIHMDILHIMILDFLHMSENAFEPIEEIEMEAIHYMIKFFYENQFINASKYPVFDNYLQIIKDLKKNDSNSKRMIFFMDEIEHILQNPVFIPKVVHLSEKEFTQLWKKHIKDENVDKFMECIEKNMIFEMKDKVMEDVFFFLLDQKEMKTGYIQIMQKFISLQKYTELMDKVIDNIQDYSLDINNIHKKILKIFEIIENIKNEEWREKIYKTMSEDDESEKDNWENMISDDDEDEDFMISRFS
jgi:hypothetical protein